MVRKRSKRKALSSTTSTANILENIEKNSNQTYNEDLANNKKKLAQDREMSESNINTYLKRSIQPESDYLAIERTAMVFL